MRRLVLLLAASGLASPVLAQHQDHGDHQTTVATEPSCTPEHQAMGHCTMPPAPHRAEPTVADNVSPQEDPHAGHQMPAEPTADPHAGHQMPAQPSEDPHAGHTMQTEPAEDPHAGHGMEHSTIVPPVAPAPPAAFTGPEHAADAFYGESAMAMARHDLIRMHGGLSAYRVLVDRLEARIRDGRDGYAFDAEAWYGGDIDKLWLKAEGHGELGAPFEGAELQALWSHAIGPFFDLQTGLRLDSQRGPDRGHLVLGVQGLAPYWIEVDASAFLSDRGDLTAWLEAEHDTRITQQLILQPRTEVQFALQDVPEERIGSGLTSTSIGARLRYQVTQLFAPYVGVEYERAFGDSRRFLRAEGEDASHWNLVAGVRFWF